MNIPTQDPSPCWSASAFPQFACLDENTRADVVVVGGGITGLTTAYLLANAGRKVVLLERARCAMADTGHTSAHLTMVTDTPLDELARRFGRAHAQGAWEAGLAAMAQIDRIVRDHAIAAEFGWVNGYRHLPAPEQDAAPMKALRDEAALAAEMGFDAEFRDEVPLFGVPGVCFPRQARVHPRKYLAGLADAITAKGGRIYERTAVGEFCPDPLSVRANGHTVTCGDLVIATHYPLVGIAGATGATLFQTKLALYTSYVIAGRVAKGVVPDALWWDTADPYRFLRIEPRSDHDVVVLGGEDHKTGQVADTAACYTRLEQELAARAPGIRILNRWSGQVVETPDGLPFVGPTAPRQYSATGYSGNGLTFGTAAAMILADQILGRSNPWAQLFDPSRSVLGRGTWQYLKENVDYPYYLVRDRFAGVEAQSLRSVMRGQGKIVERDGVKVAAYRDEAGAIALRSATCTHMGCLVAWNEAERTWDCPCHGSRFKPTGEVISGPAETPLSHVD